MSTAFVRAIPFVNRPRPIYKGPIAFNPWHVYSAMNWTDVFTLRLSATGPIKGRGSLNSPVFVFHMAANSWGGLGAFRSSAFIAQFGSGLAAVSSALLANATYKAGNTLAARMGVGSALLAPASVGFAALAGLDGGGGIDCDSSVVPGE